MRTARMIFWNVWSAGAEAGLLRAYQRRRRLGRQGGWGGAASKLHRVIRDRAAKTSQTLVEPHLIDAEFHEAWMPFFCKSWHPVVTAGKFLGFVDPFLPQEPVVDGYGQLWPNQVWPKPTLAKTKFGQTKFGQNHVWPNELWPNQPFSPN